MPKKFLFITHLTPSAKATELRRELNAVYVKALQAQTYENWSVLVLADQEKVDGKFRYIKLNGQTRDEINVSLREIYSRHDVQQLISGSDYVIKLDDDDVISKTILSSASELDFDCYYDEWHTFYDLASGVTTQQKREWIASTCIHASKHILAHYDEEGSGPLKTLLYSDHSRAWHRYYADKKTIVASRSEPVYLRVLSPTSITAGQLASKGKLNEDDLERYKNYLSKFGSWKKADIHSFSHVKQDLIDCWRNYSGLPLQEFSFLKNGFITRHLSRFLSYGKRA